jgi:hypothetical protein
MKKKRTADEVAQDIWGLYERGDLVQVLMQDRDPDENIESLDGLRLAANCLRFAHLRVTDNDVMPDLTESTEREAEIKKALTKLAKETGAWFVVFYRLEGSKKFNFGWSRNIQYEQAFNAVLGYIEYLTERVSFIDTYPLPDNLLPCRGE